MDIYKGDKLVDTQVFCKKCFFGTEKYYDNHEECNCCHDNFYNLAYNYCFGCGHCERFLPDVIIPDPKEKLQKCQTEIEYDKLHNDYIDLANNITIRIANLKEKLDEVMKYSEKIISTKKRFGKEK